MQSNQFTRSIIYNLESQLQPIWRASVGRVLKSILFFDTVFSLCLTGKNSASGISNLAPDNKQGGANGSFYSRLWIELCATLDIRV